MKQIDDFIGGILGLIFLGCIAFAILASGNTLAKIDVAIIAIVIPETLINLIVNGY